MHKIFILLPNLDAGGAERVTITIARILRDHGYIIEFINFGKPNGEMYNWIYPEFPIKSLNLRRTIFALHGLIRIMKENPNSIFFSSREHVNIINLLSARYSKATTVIRIPNMPKNILVHGLMGIKTRIIKIINKWLLKSANSIIAQNQEMKSQLIDYYNLPDDIIHIVNNPIDHNYIINQANQYESPFDNSNVNFVSVCNIAYSKGIDILLSAWPIVKNAIPNAKMYIIGRNTSEYAKKIIKETTLSDFYFVGFKKNPYPYIKNCNVFVLPSRMEGFPNVILEAICLKRPIATTNCVKVIEDIIIPDKNGFYCPVEDPLALADCMIKASRLTNINVTYNLFNKEKLLNCFK